MKKKYAIAIESHKNKPFPSIEMVYPKKEYDTFEEAEKAVESLLESNQNSGYSFCIIPKYSR